MRLTIAPTVPTKIYPSPTVTIETPGDDLTIHDFVDLCKQAALAFGYHPENVAESFPGEE